MISLKNNNSATNPTYNQLISFITKDKGLVYIDCTGSYPHKPGNRDLIVKLKAGKQYRPTALFTSRLTYYSMGTVKSL